MATKKDLLGVLVHSSMGNLSKKFTKCNVSPLITYKTGISPRLRHLFVRTFVYRLLATRLCKLAKSNPSLSIS